MLREFKPSDRSEFLAMAQAFYSGPAVLHTVDTAHFEKTFRLSLEESPYIKSFIVEHNGEIAGYSLLSLTYSNEMGGICVFIEEIYVKPEYRGLGLGAKAIRHILDLFSDAKRIRLEVTKENSGAIRLYQKLGFQFLDYLQMSIDRE